MTNAAMTPGTHPQSVNKNTITIDPQPLSKTANGGNKIAHNTRKQLIFLDVLYDSYFKNHDSII